MKSREYFPIYSIKHWFQYQTKTLQENIPHKHKYKNSKIFKKLSYVKRGQQSWPNGVFLGMSGWFNIQKSTNVILVFANLRREKIYHLSGCSEKYFTISNLYSNLWKLSRLGKKREKCYNMMKHPKTYSNHEKAMRQTKMRDIA